MLKSALPKSRDVILCYALLIPLMFLNLSWSSSSPPHSHCSQGCTLTFTSFLAGKYHIQQSTSPVWLISHLSWEVFVNVLQKPPRFLVPCCCPSYRYVASSSPQENQSHQIWGFCQLSEECLIDVFLIMWPVTHCHIGLPNNSDPHEAAPDCFITSLCAFWVIFSKKGNSPSSTWHVLPKRPGCIHLSTLVMWVSPLYLCDPNEVIAL